VISPELLTQVGFYVEREFLDRGACGALVQELRAAEGTPATVLDRAESVLDPQARRTTVSRVSPATFAETSARLEALRPRVERHFGCQLRGHERPQFLSYREGDYFRPHRDAVGSADYPANIDPRHVSVVLFLNEQTEDGPDDTYWGGWLTFYGLLGDQRAARRGLPLAAPPGLLIAFRADVVHEVRPVTRGRRYSVVSWFF
jgi:predicted 2-oxoglutarate/Fe(II)-dependent dioxygenase YbiX